MGCIINGSIEIAVKQYIDGFSLYHVFFCGKTNNTCLTAMDLGGSLLSLEIGVRAIYNAIYFP